MTRFNHNRRIPGKTFVRPASFCPIDGSGAEGYNKRVNRESPGESEEGRNVTMKIKRIAALLLVLLLTVGLTPSVWAEDDLPFTDVSESNWFYDDVT